MCESCGKGRDSFGSDKTFLNHSCEKTIVTCTKCDKQYSSKLVLRRHIETIHNKKLFSCDKCPVQLKSYTNFKVHQKRHTVNEKSYSCEECGKSLIRKSSLKRHMKTCYEKIAKDTKHKANYSCNVCNEAFKSKQILNVHKRTHNSDLIS